MDEYVCTIFFYYFFNRTACFFFTRGYKGYKGCVPERNIKYLTPLTTVLCLLFVVCCFVLGETSGKATAAAWELLRRLIERDLAHVSQFNILIASTCNSDQMRTFIDETMINAGVFPDVPVYNSYVTRLMVEGKYSAATQVVHEEMERRRIVPDVTTHTALDHSAAELNQMRKHAFANYWKRGGSDATGAARQLLQQLIETNLVNIEHFNYAMQKFCHSSDQMVELMDVDMKKANVAPSATTLHIYQLQLHIEGNEDNKDNKDNEDNEDNRENRDNRDELQTNRNTALQYTISMRARIKENARRLQRERGQIEKDQQMQIQKLNDAKMKEENALKKMEFQKRLHVQRGAQLNELLRFGADGEVAAERLLLTLHRKGLTTPEYYFDMVSVTYTITVERLEETTANIFNQIITNNYQNYNNNYCNNYQQL